MDIDNIMAFSENGITHENGIDEQLSDYEDEGFSSEIVARIPNYDSEIKERNGNSDTNPEGNGITDSFVKEVVESNGLNEFKELHVGDFDESAQPKSKNAMINKDLGLKREMKNNIDDKNAKKTSKPMTNIVKAHLSKQPRKSNSPMASVAQFEGVKEMKKVKSKTVETSTAEGRTHSSHSSTTEEEKPQRVGTLPVYGFSFKCKERAEKRKEFYSKLEEKIHAKEVEKSTLQAKTKENQEAELKMLRKSLAFKATPLPSFYQEPHPPKTELKKIPTTRAKSPKLGRKKDSPTRTETNGSYRPVRLSLDERTKLPSNGLSPLPVKKPIRKSLPKLPSEKTKLPSISNGRKESTSREITISSNETKGLESQQNKDSSHTQVPDSLPKLPSEKTKLASISNGRKESTACEITISSNETNELESHQNKDSSHAPVTDSCNEAFVEEKLEILNN